MSVCLWSGAELLYENTSLSLSVFSELWQFEPVPPYDPLSTDTVTSQGHTNCYNVSATLRSLSFTGPQNDNKKHDTRRRRRRWVVLCSNEIPA